jgi:hypothetical protein
VSDESNETTGFDDSELEDIMSEIESLESDFEEDESGVVSESSEEPVSESPEGHEMESKDEHETVNDPVLSEDGDDTLSEIENALEEPDRIEEELKAKGEEIFPDVDNSSLAVNSLEDSKKSDLQMVIDQEMGEAVKNSSPEPEVNISSKNPTVPHSEMSFSVEGDMTLKLNFSVGGEQISLHIDEETGFVIELSSGAKFTLPIESSLKKAS